MEELFMRVFERRDWVEAQMRQQFVSYSESLVYTLLAAGRRPPPWLLPHSVSTTVTQGNTLRRLSLDFANLKRTDDAPNALPKSHQVAEQNTLEFDGVKPGSCDITNCSETVNRCQNLVSETILTQFTSMRSLNEDPSSTDSLKVRHSIVSLLLQKNILHPIEANLHETPHTVTSPLPEKETAQATEMDSLGGPSSMASPLHDNNSLHSDKPTVLEGDDSIASPLPENNGMHIAETNYPEGPPSAVNLLLEKEALCLDETNFLEGPHPMAWPLLAEETKYTSETDYHEELHVMESPLHEEATSHCVKTNPIEESHSMPSPQLEKGPLHTVEHTETLRSRFLDSSIDKSSKILELHRVKTNSLAEPHSVKTNFLEEPHSVPSPQLENKPLQTVEHTETLGSRFFASSIDGNSRILELHNVKTNSLAEPHSMPSSQLESELLQIVDDTETFTSRFLDSSIDGSSKILEQQSLECHVVPLPCNESSLQSVELADTTSGAPEVLLDTVQRNSITLANKCLRSLWHEGTEQNTFCFNRAMEINASSCTAVYDKQIHSTITSVQHLPPSYGSGEMVTSFKSKVQSTVSHEDRPAANRIQVEENFSGERAVMTSSTPMNCQSDCVLNSSSSTTSTSSLSCQDDTHDQMETREYLMGKPQPSVPYSSTSESCVFIPLNLGGKSDANNCKSLVAHEDHLNAYSSPERRTSSPSDVICCYSPSPERRTSSPSDVICCNSPSMKASSGSGNTSSSDMPLVAQNSQSHSLEKALDTVINSSPSCSDTLSDGDADCIRKINPCFKYPDADVPTAIQEDKVVTAIDYVTSGSRVSNPVDYSSTTLQTTFPSYDLNQQSQLACASNELLQEKLSSAPSLEFDEDGMYDGQPEPVSDGAIPWKNEDIYADYDETVQQCQSFSIPIASNTKSSTIKERAFEGLCDSTKLVNLSCNLSRKYKMDSKLKPLSGIYQSLAARFEKLTYDETNANSVQEDNEIPLTPSVEKYSLEKLSGRTKSSLGCMGSTSELACFRIDEGSSFTEENENQEKLPRCPSRDYSSQGSVSRKPLKHITNLYQSKVKSASLSTRYLDVGRLGLKTTQAYNRESSRQLHIRTDQVIKDLKDNRAPSIRKAGVTQPLHGSASRTGILGTKNVSHRSEANLEKGWKPSNIVTNIASFVPLVKQKQQPITGCVKKVVKVRALEAAEAAKHLQEKKQNERDMRKATLELERERLKQERKRKQKQEDQKKKIDAAVVTKKRQREDDEKKENERKKKCVEKARKQQKQREEQMPTAIDEKDDCQKNPDNKEVGKGLVGGMKHQLVSDEMKEYIHRFIASESGKLKAVVAVGRSESSGLGVQESFSDDIDESYEMSPYKDSDEEDDEDFAHKEEVRRQRKFIPSWTWEENLDKILLSNQTLDPGAIFTRKCSFKLSDVLPLHIPQRRLI